MFAHSFARPFFPTALASKEWPALRTLLRSLGQIVLQAHAGTGACVLAALALTDWRLACAALLGAAAANVCAVVAGHADAAIREGRAGFNGALAGLAAQSFIGDTSLAAAVALIAGGASAWIGGALEKRLAHWPFALYSAPCLIVTWLWLLPMHAPAGFAAPFTDTPTSLAPLSGVLSALAQTVFANGAAAGACVLIGIAMNSRGAACFALGGAALASALELACGTPFADIDAGLAGFNGALAALATCALGARAGCLATLLAAAFHLIALRCGVPALTAPFVLASWCTHWAMKSRLIGAI